MRYTLLRRIYLKKVVGSIVTKKVGSFGYGGVLKQLKHPAEFYEIRDGRGRIHKTLLEKVTKDANDGVQLDVGDKINALIHRFVGVGDKHLLDTKLIKWYEKTA